MWATKKFMTRNIKYSYVDDEDKENLVARSSDSDDKSESTLEGGDALGIRYDLRSTRRSRLPYVTGNTTGVVALSLVYGLSIFAAVMGTCAWQGRGNNMLKKTSAYCKSPPVRCIIYIWDDVLTLVFIAPVLDKVHLPLIKTKIDATLFPDPSNPNHIYRMPPSPEVDAAWERISRMSLLHTTLPQVQLMLTSTQQTSACTP